MFLTETYPIRIYEKLKVVWKSSNSLVRKFKKKKGIEIGGTTDLFSFELPIYRVVGKLDGCNFSTDTLWEHNLKEGENYNYYKKKNGYQYIREASDLKGIESNKYDFLLASHCLEHCANPIKTIKEWLRVIKPGGYILLVLPDKRYTFDHNRDLTTFEHILEDYKNGTDEKDLTHMEEILSLHDLEMDPDAGGIENFRKLCLDNYKIRGMHHHVFDFNLLEEIFSFLKIKVVSKQFIEPYHQLVLTIKK